ncbi:hypothetical protein EYF80_042963 [Liparis tanakae]|uniref:Uncharacterized protein n=1 Tax=Liparis tanakae TaxID=230148 RepID=A0A4Z2G1M9_9TELE|nr:hypothetical protein EYF80_042963 [Liparis tanakae]
MVVQKTQNYTECHYTLNSWRLSRRRRETQSDVSFISWEPFADGRVTFYLLRYVARRDRVTCCCGEHQPPERGSLPLIEAAAGTELRSAVISCELTSRKSHIWLESQKFTTLK